ncbi:MAG: stage III sporulation protein AE [Oscillospiraceae bacterium]|nr:stage III sporulation protein AE [Oscillospiraceae bacterium]
MDGLSVTEAAPEEGLRRVWDYVSAHAAEALAEALRPAAAVLAVALLCSLAGPMAQGSGNFDYINLGGTLAIAAAAITDVQSVAALGADTVDRLCDYSRVLLPTLTAAAVGAGAVTSAGVKYAAAALFTDLLLTFSRDLILPLICAYVALVTARAALGTGQLTGAVKLLQWGTAKLMKYMVLAFTGYLGMSGLLSAGADAAAAKAAKAALSTALPVVGRTLADASEALVAGAGLLRNAVGAFGLVAVLAAAALPILRIGLRYLLYKAAAAVAGVAAGGRLSALVDGIGTAYGLILGLVGAAVIFEYVSIIALMRSVGL